MTIHPACRALGNSLSAVELAQLIDISAVQAQHTETDVRDVANLAVQYGFIAAHALSNFVPLLRDLIPVGGRTLVGGPIGFPSGGNMTAVKVMEAVELAKAGAEELDMMMNIGRLKSNDISYVVSEIREVVAAIAPLPLKVILEVGRLTDNEIRRGSDAVVEGHAAFVKTGTGWLSGGTSVEQIGLIAGTVDGAVQIKASGGIRSLTTMAEMIRLGVTRFGISTGFAIALVQECDKLPEGRLSLQR